MNPDSDHPVKLTAAARSYLKLFLDHRNSPPTLFDLYRRNIPVAITLAVIFMGAAALAYFADLEWLSIFSIGVLWGCLTRDFSALRRAVDLWPTTAAVIDWPRLEKLLSESDRDH